MRCGPVPVSQRPSIAFPGAPTQKKATRRSGNVWASGRPRKSGRNGPTAPGLRRSDESRRDPELRSCWRSTTAAGAASLCPSHPAIVVCRPVDFLNPRPAQHRQAAGVLGQFFPAQDSFRIRAAVYMKSVSNSPFVRLGGAKGAFRLLRGFWRVRISGTRPDQADTHNCGAKTAILIVVLVPATAKGPS